VTRSGRGAVEGLDILASDFDSQRSASINGQGDRRFGHEVAGQDNETTYAQIVRKSWASCGAHPGGGGRHRTRPLRLGTTQPSTPTAAPRGDGGAEDPRQGEEDPAYAEVARRSRVEPGKFAVRGAQKSKTIQELAFAPTPINPPGMEAGLRRSIITIRRSHFPSQLHLRVASSRHARSSPRFLERRLRATSSTR